MKKITAVLFSCFVALEACADYEYTSGWALQYGVTDAIKATWGNPSVDAQNPQDANRDSDVFQIKKGYACCVNDELYHPEAIENAPFCEDNGRKKPCKDSGSFMAFVAHNISEHGAEFCLTQFSAVGGTAKFSLYHQQPRWPGLGCMWFCEPGWDGIACQERTSPEASCNMVNIKQSIANVKTKKYEGNDALAMHMVRQGFAEYMAILDSAYAIDKYPKEIVIGAVDFMEHGIVAKPMSVGAVGNLGKSSVTSSTVAGKTKVLCAQGFTADDKCNVSSQNCGKTLWCNEGAGKYFDSSKHVKQMNGFCETFVCKNYDEALDDNYNCKSCKSNGLNGRCDVLGKTTFGKCIECGIGQIFNPSTCECDVARTVSTAVLQYGTSRAGIVTNQCWTKTDAASYKECVLSAIE